MRTKLASTLAVAMLAASSFAFAADNGGKNDGKDGMDNTTTNSTKNSTGDIDDQKACRDGSGGGAPCSEDGTTMDMQQ